MMQNVRLLRMTLRNFKGIRDLTICFDGKNTNILGRNACGKTSLMDAFCWVMYGKDSKNKADFEIKTLDSQGKPTPGINHEVEITLLVNGSSTTLKKSYVEVWTKKRGQATEQFTGNTTNHYIDDVPKTKKDYDSFVETIGSESMFKLLTNPLFFNDEKAFHWTKRREILLEVCGNVEDSDVIAANHSLNGLKDILGKRSIEDHRKVIAEKRKKINDELEQIPIRIDEINKTLKGDAKIDVVAVNSRIETLGLMKQDKEAEIFRAQNDTETAQKEKRIAEIDKEIMDREMALKSNLFKAKEEKQDQLSNQQLEVRRLDSEITIKNREKSTFESQVTKGNALCDELRSQWVIINDEKFELNQETVCPTCGQGLSEEKLSEARRIAEEQFNLNKSTRLTSISQKGIGEKEKIQQHQVEISVLESQIADSCTQKNNCELYIAKINDEIITIDNTLLELKDDSPGTAVLKAEKAKIEQELSTLKSSKNSIILSLRDGVIKLAAEIDTEMGKLAEHKQREASRKRVEELAEQEKTLSQEYQRLEKELFLTEKFMREKVFMLEDRINNKFKLARFKLFNEQVNGGLEETCQTMIDGVPFASLNNAAQYNVGIDIINTLSEHYGYKFPLWLDNRESVSEIVENDLQVISLIVSPEHAVLTVEESANAGLRLVANQ